MFLQRQPNYNTRLPASTTGLWKIASVSRCLRSIQCWAAQGVFSFLLVVIATPSIKAGAFCLKFRRNRGPRCFSDLRLPLSSRD